ncbi:LysR family transcriptional regulator [Actinophytocola algeriensis]|uniref:DNA-binding transcriptional LysR family regulator n=1 Tax=Actinophytocola algeriensis TaxID=1768010 RepID=A0A7W7Q777_9PSEU|nr:LysR family transcriptional regulator [Actinophytocola algeriensis]MBB4908361.1 DNA-binding transcriptional LysR family regulator [Actinophytocola algeriensis]MBE1475252.1 DNA-binding transcriptional LysR family regulator [Actinophytocola algeriensis]
MDLDLGTVRAFVAVADDRHFGAAADRLGLSQQAVSKRIAKLESGLGVTLLHRDRTGTALTDDGVAFLPHARALIAMAEAAVASLGGRDRPLRVDVLGTRLAPTELIRRFHDAHRDVEIDIVTSRGLRTGLSALANGTVDAAFARVTGVLDPRFAHIPAYAEPHRFLASRKHRLAGRRRVRLADLAGSVAWMPGNEPGSEWTDLYTEMRREFGLRISVDGPDFGLDHLIDALAAAPDRYMFTGEAMRVPWHPGVVQIPVVDPTPVYPWSMVWLRRNRHPALPRLIDHVTAGYEPFDPARQWLPVTDIRDGGFG